LFKYNNLIVFCKNREKVLNMCLFHKKGYVFMSDAGSLRWWSQLNFYPWCTTIRFSSNDRFDV